jgi:predicted nucleotidyltransferase
MDLKTIISKLLKIDASKRIKFIILFGSTSTGMDNPLSDIDIAVYYEGTPRERFRFRVKALGELPDKIDLHIFQDLPLVVKKEVISGKMLYSQSFEFIFEEAMKVIKEFDSFEKYYNEYLHELKTGVEA